MLKGLLGSILVVISSVSMYIGINYIRCDEWLVGVILFLLGIEIARNFCWQLIARYNIRCKPAHDLWYGQVVYVLVPVYNEKHSIVETLDSINRQTYKWRTRVVLVDDCSTDGTSEILKDYEFSNPHLRKYLVKTPSNTGCKAGAMIKGIHLIRELAFSQNGKGLLFIVDSDTVLDDNAILNMVGYMKLNPRQAGASGVVLTKDQPGRLAKIQMMEHLCCYHLAKAGMGYKGFVSVMSGAFCAIRLEALSERRVGFFGEKNLVEDICWTWRAFCRGERLGYAIDAIAMTDNQPTLTKLIKQRVRWARGPIEAYRDANTNDTKALWLMRGKIVLDLAMASAQLTFLVLAFKYPLLFLCFTIVPPFIMHWMNVSELREILKNKSGRLPRPYLRHCFVTILLSYPLCILRILGALSELLGFRKVWGTR